VKSVPSFTVTTKIALASTLLVTGSMIVETDLMKAKVPVASVVTTKKVIGMAKRCNGNYDCDQQGSDWSDEQDCETCDGDTFYASRRVPWVNNGNFHCDNKRCLIDKHRCDGNNDCGDNSDEVGCFACDTNSTEMVNPVLKCNGEADCSGGSDEINCEKCDRPIDTYNDFGSFHCSNKRCIKESEQCDGKDDCGDKSDETNCEECGWSFDLYGGLSGSFHCNNDKCIGEGRICDGQDDCGDNSDESDCFVCDNMKTIRAVLKNNGIDECGDMSDESLREISWADLLLFK